MNKIKLTFFLPSLDPGGAEKNVVNIINNINGDKFTTSLVLGEKKGEFLEKTNRNVDIVGLNSSSSLGLFFKLVKYIHVEKPDVFVSSFTRINIIVLLACFFSGSKTKIIATEHTAFSSLPGIAKTTPRKMFAIFLLPVLSRLVYPLSASIVCASTGIADDFKKNVGCNSKVRVIYNPVTSNKIENLSREEIDEPEITNIKAPIILAVGRLVKCKDYPNLLKAFSLVLKKHASHLVVLGSGPEEDGIKKLISRLGLLKNVSLLGFKANPYKYMGKASVFVLSSFQEGFGNVIIEAMACGIPVVSTDCPVGPREIINNGVNGLLVPMKDENAMSAAIIKILDNPQMAENLSREGKIRAEYFSIEKSVGEYEKLFNEILKIKT